MTRATEVNESGLNNRGGMEKGERERAGPGFSLVCLVGRWELSEPEDCARHCLLPSLPEAAWVVAALPCC